MPKSKKPKRRFNPKRSRARIPTGETGFRGNQFMIEKVLDAAAKVPSKRK